MSCTVKQIGNAVQRAACDANYRFAVLVILGGGQVSRLRSICGAAGQTDELGYSASRDFKCGHSDIHATIQHLLGIDYQKNTFPFEGRDESLVGVNPARVLKELFT